MALEQSDDRIKTNVREFSGREMLKPVTTYIAEVLGKPRDKLVTIAQQLSETCHYLVENNPEDPDPYPFPITPG